GLKAWPTIPRSEDWKTSMLARLGLPNQNPSDIGLGWKKLLSRVNNFADLEAALLGKVEHMIDFVTVNEQYKLSDILSSIHPANSETLHYAESISVKTLLLMNRS